MDLSVIIPVRNESGNILPMVTEMRAVLENRYDYEIIYVDDFSTDTTAEELLLAARQCPKRLRILRHASPYGQSSALLSGVKAARAPVIVTLDGDGQNDPADIPALVERLPATTVHGQVWLVIGWRKERQDNLVRRIASKIANAVRNRLLKDATPDTGCGLKVFHREAFLALPHFDHMHRFLPVLFQRAGGKVMSVPVNHRPRQYGKSKYGIGNRLWVGLTDLAGVLWLMRRPCHAKTREIR